MSRALRGMGYQRGTSYRRISKSCGVHYILKWSLSCIVLPSVFTNVTPSCIRSLAAGRCPPCDDQGRPRFSEAPSYLVVGSYDGSTVLVDLRDPAFPIELNRARSVYFAVEAVIETYLSQQQLWQWAGRPRHPRHCTRMWISACQCREFTDRDLGKAIYYRCTGDPSGSVASI